MEAATPEPEWTISVPLFHSRVSINVTTNNYTLYQKYLQVGFCGLDREFRENFDHRCFRQENISYLIIFVAVIYSILVLAFSGTLAFQAIRTFRREYRDKAWAYNYIVLPLIAFAVFVGFLATVFLVAMPTFIGWLAWCAWQQSGRFCDEKSNREGTSCMSWLQDRRKHGSAKPSSTNAKAGKKILFEDVELDDVRSERIVTRNPPVLPRQNPFMIDEELGVGMKAI